MFNLNYVIYAPCIYCCYHIQFYHVSNTSTYIILLTIKPFQYGAIKYLNKYVQSGEKEWQKSTPGCSKYVCYKPYINIIIEQVKAQDEEYVYQLSYNEVIYILKKSSSMRTESELNSLVTYFKDNQFLKDFREKNNDTLLLDYVKYVHMI